MSQIVSAMSNKKGLGDTCYDPVDGTAYDCGGTSPSGYGGYGGSGGVVNSGGGISASTASMITSIANSIGGFFNRATQPGGILNQLHPGQMVQTTPYGTTQYYGAPGSYAGIPATSMFGSSMGTILLVGAGVLLVVMISKR